jgi:hypothetical protein
MVEENRGAVRLLLERSQTTKSAPQIWKELPKHLTLTRKELPILLEDMVAAGEIFIWPGKGFGTGILGLKRGISSFNTFPTQGSYQQPK